MHIDLLETQALPRPTQPTTKKRAHLHKVRFEIQAQDTQQMPQAPGTGRESMDEEAWGNEHGVLISSIFSTINRPPTYRADPYVSSQGVTPTEIMVPIWERVARGEGVNGAGLLNEPTIRLRTLASREKKQGDLLDIPRFIGYTMGAVAVLGLYLIIPLMILLNAILPSTWNRLFVALGILAVGEMLICTVLAKTIPKGTRQRRHVVQENRGDVLVQL